MNNTIKKILCLGLLIMVSSCKMTIETEIDVSILDKGNGQYVDIHLIVEDANCNGVNMPSNLMQFTGCNLGDDGKYYSGWIITANVVTDKNPSFDRPISLYYGKMGTIIFVVGRQYMEYIPELTSDDIHIIASIKNDTKSIRRMVVKGVWVDGKPVNDVGAVFSMNPCSVAEVRLSDVGTASVVGSGVAPTAVVYDPKES